LTVPAIIHALEKLLELHNGLLELSRKKTEAVKTGSMDTLMTLIARERKQIRKVEKAETERMKLVTEWFAANDLAEEEHTITMLLNRLETGQLKTKLLDITTRLTEVVTLLKQQEGLNHALIQQSMQFVQYSLDLINPTIQSINYGSASDKQNESATQSLFDSKA
jgi:FlgN protein